MAKKKGTESKKNKEAIIFEDQSAKEEALHNALANIEKQFGKGAVM
jgi:hypothetical protein